MTIRDQVTEFHRAFGVPVRSTPAVPEDGEVRLRLRLVLEEAFELLAACTLDATDADILKARTMAFVNECAIGVDPVEVADALADIDYVVEGARLVFGIDGEPIAAEVHRSNMAKLVDGKPVVRADGKVLKPASWIAPRIGDELVKQGWCGDA